MPAAIAGGIYHQNAEMLMPSFTYTGNFIAGCCSFLSICAVSTAFAAMDPSFELDPTVLQDSAVAHNGVPKTDRRAAKVRKVRHKAVSGAAFREHTVRAGDNLFKILMRDFGLTNAEAEACIEETLRANNISDIRRLKIGKKILIPRF